MRSIKALLSAGTFALANAAIAADLPVKAPVVPQAVTNWTGFYVGVHAGYGGGMKDWGRINFPATGALAGGQFGFNQQVGNFVFGLEADGSWSGMKGSRFEDIALPFQPTDFNQTVATRIDSVVSASGRLGVAVDRWLVYGKGGVAWARESHTNSQINTIVGVPLPQTELLAASETRQGWLVGLGAEYAFLGNWSVKAEYDYLDFTSSDFPLFKGTLTSFAGVTTALQVNQPVLERLHVAKVGLNYRFGPSRPPEIAPVRTSRNYDWTGFYVGAEGAGGWQNQSWVGFDPLDSYDVRGWLAGGVAGVRVQPSVFVLGVEAEWMGGRLTGGRLDNLPPQVGGTSNRSLATRTDQVAMATMQFGFVATDRLLVYAKGGAALVHARHTDTFNAFANPGLTSAFFFNQGDVWHTGGVVGAGAEYAFSGNWSVKLEYDFIGLLRQQVFLPGTLTEIEPGLGTGTTSVPASATLRASDLQLVKLGINYRFGPDVVRAKY